MNHFVYIIYSQEYDKYYKGYTTNVDKRIQQHNEGYTRYSKLFRPWTLIYLEVYSTKREALIREKRLKKYSKEQINNLAQIDHPNRVHF